MLLRAKPLFACHVVAAAVTVAAVLVRWGAPLVPSRAPGDPIAAALAELDHRPTVARLSADAPHRAYEKTPARYDAALDLIADFEKSPLPDRASHLQALGIAHMLRRDHDGAIRLLREAVALVEMQPVGPERKAAILNDFAVAQYEQARSGDGKSFIISLDASEKAWALNRTPATAWTRATLLSALASHETASAAWRDYLDLDSTSGWAKEVAREKRTARPQRVTRVGKTVLAPATAIVTVMGSGSASVEHYDRVIEERIRVGDDDGAAQAFLLRAETLDGMSSADEGWCDRIQARKLASGDATEAVVMALAVAAMRDGYVHAARALFSDVAEGAQRRDDKAAHVHLTRWRTFANPLTQDSLDVAPRFAAHRRDEVTVSVETDAATRARDLDPQTVRALVEKSMRGVYEREARIEGANGAIASAFWMSDRARSVTEPRERSSPCFDAMRRGTPEVLGQQLARCVPDGVTVVHQDLDAENLYTWVIRDGNIALTTTPVSAARLVAEIEQFQSDVQKGGNDMSLVRQVQHLYDVLLRPIQQSIGSGLLVYSPSTSLREVPLAALHDGGAFLIERRLLTTTATISTFNLPRTLASTSSALIVLPAVALDRKELDGARREVRAVTNIYGKRADLLIGTAATPEAFLDSAADYDILHVATHGQSSSIAYQNAIEFGSRRIRAYDVFQLNLERAPVVMLAACRTADESGGSSNVSLANAFLAAGASAVVGTLWDVEDEATEELSVDFHRELVRGATPQEALRNVQLEFIRRGMPMSAWAAFRISS